MVDLKLWVTILFLGSMWVFSGCDWTKKNEKCNISQNEVKEHNGTPIINGHALPPEPDPKINNATLFGVDVNNNGVRDDVEWWIYEDMLTYHHPEIERVIAMSKAKAYQMVLFDPANKGNKVYKAIRRTLDCWSYYSDVRSLPFDGAIEKFSNRLRDKQFNTRERLKTYLDYDYAHSSKLTPLQPFTPLRLLNTSYCDQDIDVLP